MFFREVILVVGSVPKSQGLPRRGGGSDPKKGRKGLSAPNSSPWKQNFREKCCKMTNFTKSVKEMLQNQINPECANKRLMIITP